MIGTKTGIVIGGGAAGFFAAIRAKNVCPELEIVILEAGANPLRKVMLSGGGRCNLTHACVDVGQFIENYPRGQREIRGIFSRFGPEDTVTWFESHGVKLKTEADGRIFPVSDSSQTVIQCLFHASKEANVKLCKQAPVQELLKRWDRYVITTPASVWEADAVLLATGSYRKGYQWAKALGHRLIHPVPSLFAFQIQDSRLEGLAGIRFDRVVGHLEIEGEKPIVQEGPLLITHWGMSGPLILKLSAWGARVLYAAGYRASLCLDFLPEQTLSEVQELLNRQKDSFPHRQLGSENPLGLPKRFWQKTLAGQGIDPERRWGEASQKSLNGLAEGLKRSLFQVEGQSPHKEEFVTAGGVSLREIDCRTMESRCAKGLYLAGEVIDIDGLTGGFNFQNAWSTGWVAGESMARKLST